MQSADFFLFIIQGVCHFEVSPKVGQKTFGAHFKMCLLYPQESLTNDLGSGSAAVAIGGDYDIEAVKWTVATLT